MPDTSSSRTILVTGATGFIGSHLVPRLVARGDRVIALARRPAVATLLGAGVEVVTDLARIPADRSIEAVVNLAGARILGLPWTAARRRELLGSRLGTTDAVLSLLRRLATPPQVLVNASAVGYYGLSGERPVDESAPPQAIFQSELCRLWEERAMTAESLGVRVVRLRFGVVLGADGGALPQLARPVRLGLGGVLGDGRQGFPWIHLEDALRLIEFTLDGEGLSGPFNAVAPQPVTHRQFQQALGRVLSRPVWAPVPAFLLRAALGEMAQLLVDGQDVRPRRTLEAGFTFRFSDLDTALGDLLGPSGAIS
jgi:uncharacterized protein (TIGR01777 family)